MKDNGAVILAIGVIGFFLYKYYRDYQAETAEIVQASIEPAYYYYY